MDANAVSPDHEPHFRTTRWTLLGAAGATEPETARRALVDLCVQYWAPVYAFVRRCGHGPERAQDITETFFQDLLQRPLPAAASGGPFRKFLIDSINRFLAADWTGEPGRAAIPDLKPPGPLDEMERADRAQNDTVHNAELAFQRSYALRVVGSALQRLRGEARQAGRIDMFDALEPYLNRDPEPGRQAELAAELHVRPLALVMALKRLRQRFFELVDAELAETVDGDDALAAERDALLRALGGGA